jgi:hypothetical protein
MADEDPKFHEAIESGDFTTAGEIKAGYDSRRDQLHNDTLSNYLKELRALGASCREHLQMESFTVHDQTAHEQSVLRKQISDTFHQLQVQHVATLVEFEKEHLLKISREKIRATQTSNELRDQAKAAATGKNFTHAQNLLEQATFIAGADLASKEDVIKKSFLEGRAKLFETQRGDLSLLSNTLKDELENLDRAERVALQDLAKRYRKTFYNDYREFTRRIKTEVADLQLRVECLKRCAQLYSSLFQELDAPPA